MASGNLLNGEQNFAGESHQNSHSENHESSSPSVQTRPVRQDRRAHIAPALSMDSGVSSIEHLHVLDMNEMWSVSRPEDSAEETLDRTTFSEDELLDITFEACSTTGTGEVLPSTIMQYLQTMTGQGPEQERLSALYCMLDPERLDPTMSRATFRATMTEWIAQCSQAGMYDDNKHSSVTDSRNVSLNGIDLSGPEIKTTFSDGAQCNCGSGELLGAVTALHRMRKQNSSLLQSASQCEDTNLQLTAEIAELRAKLASARRSGGGSMSLVEELDEARRAVREAQERASLAQASNWKLIKECACLKAHIKVLEDKNEQLLLDRTYSEDCLNVLRKVNAEMMEELEETNVMLAIRDRELTKKEILMDKLKWFHLENHRIIQGLQSEFMLLSEHSQEALKRRCSSPPGLHGRSGFGPNRHSLHAEIQNVLQHGGLEEESGPVCGPLSYTTQRVGIQNLKHRIKSAELAHLHHTHYPERSRYSHSQQPQTSFKQQHVGVYEMELQPHICEGREGQEQRPKPKTKRAAEVNCWRVLNVEGGRTTDRLEDTLSQPSDALTKVKLQQAEKNFIEMRNKVCQLETALRTAQWKSIQDRMSVLTKDQETNTAKVGPGCAEEEAVESRDVATDTLEEQGRSVRVAAQLVSSEDVLVTLRRMEAIVKGTLEAAELSQRMVSQVKERVDKITQKVEEVLKRAVKRNKELSALENRVIANAQWIGPTGQTAPPDVDATARDGPINSITTDAGMQVTNTSQWCSSGGIYSATGGSSNNGSKSHVRDVPVTFTSQDPLACLQSCENSKLPSTDDNISSQAHYPDWFSDPESNSTSRDGSPPACLGSIVPPVSPSVLQYQCVTPLTIPPETPPHSGCERPATGHIEENVAGLSLEDPRCSDCCQSEARDFGSGLSTSAGGFGRIQQSDPKDNTCKPEESEKTSTLKKTDIGFDPIQDHCGRFLSQTLPSVLITDPDKEGEGHRLYCFPWIQTQQNLVDSPAQRSPSKSPFVFPRTQPRPTQLPSMPVLPEEEEDSPEDLESSSSSPSAYTPVIGRAVTMTTAAPTIVYPKQATVTVVHADSHPLEQSRPHSPRPRITRSSLTGPITTVDSIGNVIDLVKDPLPELLLSEQDRQKNMELLEEAKKVSDRFLTRRGRKSISSLSESPPGLSPNHTPSSSPVPSRSSSLTSAPQIATEVNHSPSSPLSLRLEVPSVREQAKISTQEQESTRRLADWKPNEKRKVSSGTLAPRHSGPPPPREPIGGQKENCDPRTAVKKSPAEGLVRPPNQAPATGVAKPVPRPPTQQAPCTAEIKTIGAFPPLMRAVSWDNVGTLTARNEAPSLPPTSEETFSFPDKTRDALLKTSGYKDFPVQPVNVQKLSKIREEHKLMRNQTIVGSMLPELSETTEQERGPSPLPSPSSPSDEKSDAMPNISDIMLRKLKLHRGLPGCAPPLTEKEVENAFVQLSLAFRNDNYTLETRLKQAERERTMTEENTEKELEEFKSSLKCSAPQWSNMEQRDSYQRLIETVAVLHRLATRLSSRAEMVGAVRQEKRMNKATEVMMQYVENLKRTYEKDHAELMEFKKLANQNSNRCYSGSIDTGDDGVPRPSRSMLTMGKALPRRRVSVAVVPKFNLLNIPGQTPVMAGPGPTVAMGPSPQPTMCPALPVLCEANIMKGNFPTEPTQPTIAESGAEQEAEASALGKPAVNLEELRSEIKAQIEEEAYNKGYLEGLKKIKELKEVDEEKEEVKPLELEKKDNKEIPRQEKPNSKVQEILVVLDWLWPKNVRRNQIWICLTLFLVLVLVFNVFTYFNDRYNIHGDMSAEKSMAQGKKKIFGLNVGVQPKNPTPE
ncbi:hypothetical protein UPYG_G00083610 [Umbra pygmaea]|uniref:Protein MRVI1 n=1 Tax=Umbra pygmaea TaxID=75934 RepID=A0ABD0XGZ1_UMBPY